ncbi:hypothetical protein JW935_16750 [candidate division KSB1 bacterium]|nr:hypothetical protein [candidate division KSB1 bacterium]
MSNKILDGKAYKVPDIPGKFGMGFVDNAGYIKLERMVILKFQPIVLNYPIIYN